MGGGGSSSSRVHSQAFHLFYVFALFAQGGEVDVGVDSKGLPLGWESSREKPHLVNWATL